VRIVSGKGGSRRTDFFRLQLPDSSSVLTFDIVKFSGESGIRSKSVRPRRWRLVAARSCRSFLKCLAWKQSASDSSASVGRYTSSLSSCRGIVWRRDRNSAIREHRNVTIELNERGLRDAAPDWLRDFRVYLRDRVIDRP